MLEKEWKTWFYEVKDLDSLSYLKWLCKRLVENDKIDLNKVNKVYYKKTYYWTDWKYTSYVEFLDEEILLMLLSIQDNPIEFLVSILK